MLLRKIDPCIVLSKGDAAVAGLVGRQRHAWKRAQGVPDAHGARPGEITDEDEEGAAMAEYAAAKFLGVPWTTALPNARPDGPDVGTRTQVRHIDIRKPRSTSLIIRPSDVTRYGNVPWVLVRRHDLKFTLVGWIMAAEAQRGTLTDKGNGRPPAWFVSPNRLNSIEQLQNV